MAHPLDDAPAALLHRSINQTASQLGEASSRWKYLHGHLTAHINEHLENFLAPLLRMPPYPLRMTRFGIPALASATLLGKSLFRGNLARALLAGIAAHANIPQSQPLAGTFGMLFSALGTTRGWGRDPRKVDLAPVW